MSQRKLKAAFCTLGCRVNQYETRAVEESFEEKGFETADLLAAHEKELQLSMEYLSSLGVIE